MSAEPEMLKISFPQMVEEAKAKVEKQFPSGPGMHPWLLRHHLQLAEHLERRAKGYSKIFRDELLTAAFIIRQYHAKAKQPTND